MKPKQLLRRLVYMDRGFIPDLYEIVTGTSPSTLITRDEAKKAGAQIPIFSAEVSVAESRSFPVSTFEMLLKTLPELEREPDLDASSFTPSMPSQYGWVCGELSTFRAGQSIRNNQTGEMKELSSSVYFMIRDKPCLDLALITTPEYFSYGLNALSRMHETVLKNLSIPVKAYIRTLPAQSHINQWVAIPLVVVEKNDGAE